MASERRKREITEQILILLEVNRGKYLTLKEISNLLQTRKHEYKTLNDLLNHLKRENKILLKNRRYGIAASPLPKQIIGQFDATSLVRGFSYAFVNHPDGDVLIDGEDIGNAFHNDEVQIRIKFKRRGLLHGVVEKVIKRANEQFTGNIEKYKGRLYFIPDLGKIDSIFDIIELAGAQENDKVVFKVEDWGSYSDLRRPAGRVVEVLGQAGDVNTETLAVMKQFELPLEFPPAVLAEVDKLSEEITEKDIKARTDLRDLPTITIDPETAKDYDDAISIIEVGKGYELYVHIADVSHYVKLNTLLFKEAFERGNSFYFSRQVIPMLPPKISNQICSLRPDEDKLTISVITKMDEKFRITSQSVVESVIRSKARLSYEQVDAYLEGSTEQIPEEAYIVIDNLSKLSKTLSNQRYAKGYIPFNMPELEFIYDDTGKIAELKRSMETESHKIVENCMLLANEYVATRLNEFSDTGMYRVHEFPDGEAVDRIIRLLAFYEVVPTKKNLRGQKLIQSLLELMPDDKYHRVFDPLILRSMKKAKYDVQPIGHFGLATKYYTHFTSPIRRLCDLTVHHLLKQHLWDTGDQKKLAENELKKIAGRASERELVADNVEREVAYNFKKLFMKDKVGEVYEGMIVNITNSNIVVEIDEIPVTGIVPISSLRDDSYRFYQIYMELIGRKTRKIYKLMDRVTVRLDRIEYDLIFTLLEESKSRSRRTKSNKKKKG